jgi:hypothetical protein
MADKEEYIDAVSKPGSIIQQMESLDRAWYQNKNLD